MNFPILHKVFYYLALLLILSCPRVSWCYSTEDNIALRTETPVVDGSMPPDIAAIQKRGVLRQALNQTPAPPFSVLDKNGNWSGLEIDFGQQIAKNLGVKLVIVPASNYDDLVTLLVEGKADIAMGLSILPSRQTRVSFSAPYYSYHPHLLVNRLAASQMGWTTPQALFNGLKTSKKPLKVCVFAGSIVGQIMEQTFPGTQVIVYTDHIQCFEDVASGKIFASMGTTPIAIRDFLKHNPQAAISTEDVELTNMEDLLGVAVPWQDFHLREWLDIYINYLEDSGIRQKLSKQYGYPIS